MEDNGHRKDITRQVIQLFVETIGFIAPDQVTEQTDFIHDFNIIDDDLTCFVMQVEWKFSLGSSQKDWDTITTIRQIVELILRQTKGI
ncbi:acyl carrier protein [Pseudomonas sp. RGM2987]|uniref:acyl carrier protein n=1 Tax=Pseudomonas sp. RGM2987 TaxID=2930090 RepID=UPI001FD703D1|nr:acyl carrier protein [Pseudomonas sp. RGM2987]MCJ8206975.1 acyl carrier protein [Pseudomonas sp. RGM2987]